jgi:hypothetical protein
VRVVRRQQYGRNISRLVDVPMEEFAAIKQKGMDIVWLMGVWHLGHYGLNYDRTDPGTLSSYDSILPGWTLPDVIGYPTFIFIYFYFYFYIYFTFRNCLK